MVTGIVCTVQRFTSWLTGIILLLRSCLAQPQPQPHQVPLLLPTLAVQRSDA